MKLKDRTHYTVTVWSKEENRNGENDIIKQKVFERSEEAYNYAKDFIANGFEVWVSFNKFVGLNDMRQKCYEVTTEYFNRKEVYIDAR